MTLSISPHFSAATVSIVRGSDHGALSPDVADAYQAAFDKHEEFLGNAPDWLEITAFEQDGQDQVATMEMNDYTDRLKRHEYSRHARLKPLRGLSLASDLWKQGLQGLRSHGMKRTEEPDAIPQFVDSLIKRIKESAPVTVIGSLN